MPDVCGYWDRWADKPYYPRKYDDLTDFEKWAVGKYGRMPREGDEKVYETFKRKESEKSEKKRSLVGGCGLERLGYEINPEGRILFNSRYIARIEKNLVIIEYPTPGDNEIRDLPEICEQIERTLELYGILDTNGIEVREKPPRRRVISALRKTISRLEGIISVTEKLVGRLG